MIYTENAINILATKTYKGIGRAWIINNLKGNESVDTIVSLLNKKQKKIIPLPLMIFKKIQIDFR